MALQIGDLAREAGVPVSTIRYYERIGLLPVAARSAARYRIYRSEVIDEVRFIRRAQALGFSLPEIAGLLELSRAGVEPCEQVVALGRRHLAALDAKLERLTKFRSQLAAAVDSWSEGGCGFTSKGLCSLIELAEMLDGPERNKIAATRLCS